MNNLITKILNFFGIQTAEQIAEEEAEKAQRQIDAWISLFDTDHPIKLPRPKHSTNQGFKNGIDLGGRGLITFQHGDEKTVLYTHGNVYGLKSDQLQTITP